MNSLQLLPAAGERLDRLCNLNTGTHFSLIRMPTGCLVLSFIKQNKQKINNIAQASGRLLGKVTRKMFSEACKHNYGGKMAQLFRPRSITWDF